MDAMETHTDRVRSVLALIAWVVLSFSASVGGAVFTPGDWYQGLNKPVFTPPGWLFGPVWTLLYSMMGVSAWLVWRRRGFRNAGRALSLFLVQLALNAAWTPVFFGLKQPGPALFVILALWGAIAITALEFRKHSRVAAMLLCPYLLWVGFASVLNASLWWLNRAA